MQYSVLFALMVVSQIVSLAAILAVLHRVDLFLKEAMVYMKSNSIHDVLSATSLLNRKPEKQNDEGAEVVPGQDPDSEDLLIKTQQAHRNKHVKSLGAEHA